MLCSWHWFEQCLFFHCQRQIPDNDLNSVCLFIRKFSNNWYQSQIESLKGKHEWIMRIFSKLFNFDLVVSETREKTFLIKNFILISFEIGSKLNRNHQLVVQSNLSILILQLKGSNSYSLLQNRRVIGGSIASSLLNGICKFLIKISCVYRITLWSLGCENGHVSKGIWFVGNCWEWQITKSIKQQSNNCSNQVL